MVIPKVNKKVNKNSFNTKFEKHILNTIKKFKLFTKKDKILVAASGGKDSTVLLYILNKYNYNIEAVTIDAHIGCYTKDNLDRLKSFCTKQKINI